MDGSYRTCETPPQAPDHDEIGTAQGSADRVGRNVVSGQREEGHAAPPRLSQTGASVKLLPPEASDRVLDPKSGLSPPTCGTRPNGVDSYASPGSGPVGPAKGSNGAETRNLCPNMHPAEHLGELCLARSMRGAVALAAPGSGAEEEGATVKAKEKDEEGKGDTEGTAAGSKFFPLKEGGKLSQL